MGYSPTNGTHISYFIDHECLIHDAEDILHTRIQTLGVTEAEYTAPLSISQGPTWKWKVYDVSGVVSPSNSLAVGQHHIANGALDLGSSVVRYANFLPRL